MPPFTYTKATTAAEAVRAKSIEIGARKVADALVIAKQSALRP